MVGAAAVGGVWHLVYVGPAWIRRRDGFSGEPRVHGGYFYRVVVEWCAVVVPPIIAPPKI